MVICTFDHGLIRKIIAIATIHTIYNDYSKFKNNSEWKTVYLAIAIASHPDLVTLNL